MARFLFFCCFIGEIDPEEGCTNLLSYCGGTYAGIVSKLNYLEELGVDAMWISPIVYNIKDGYHGYWAENIYELNPSFGTKEDLQNLVAECHDRDIWVMVDVVPNHMGNQDTCNEESCPNPDDFSQFTPFNESLHYHEFCSIQDFENQQEVEDCRLYLLPDLNQSVPTVNDWLLDWVAALTEEYDFDGYRIDTARHITQEFFPPFNAAAGAYCVGEVYGEENKTEYIADYQNVMDGVLNYPFYFSIRRCVKKKLMTMASDHVQHKFFPRTFNENYPMGYLKDQLDIQRAAYPNIHLNAPFIDNHDKERW